MPAFTIRGQLGTAAPDDGAVPVISTAVDGADTLIKVDLGEGRLVQTYRLTGDDLAYVSTDLPAKQYVRGTLGGASIVIPTVTFAAIPEGHSQLIFSRDTGALGTAVITMKVAVGGASHILMAGAEFDGIATLAISGRSFSAAFLRADTSATYAADVTGMAAITRGSAVYVAVASGAEDGLTIFRIGTAGALTAVESQGAATGLNIDHPEVLRAVEIGGESYLLAGASGTGTISVFRVDDTGHMTLCHTATDDRYSRFAGVSVMETVSVNGVTYVVAAGTDSGLSLFALLPDGRLCLIDSIEDTTTIGINAVTGLKLLAQGNVIHVVATSQSEAGLAHLSIAVDPAGRIISGTAASETLTGGVGQDILTDGAGVDVLRGGAGADIYVVSADGQGDTITGFQPGIDKIDLSAWPRLYSTAQLQITSIAGGCVIAYGAEQLTLRTANGASLTYDSFMQVDMVGLPQVPLVPVTRDPPVLNPYLPKPTEEPTGPTGPVQATGTPEQDTLTGTDFDDTLAGLAHDDRLEGGAGHDLLQGDQGADSLYGGAGRDTLIGFTGADQIYGGADADSIGGGTSIDMIYGGTGSDTISGGTGADTIYGDDGDDFLYGNTAVDLIYGGRGHDYISSGDGVDVVYGGAGNDTILGRNGLDTIYGDAGDDYLLGSNGVDQVFGGSGSDSLSGGYGWDVLYGGVGADTIYGNIGSDRIMGEADGDYLAGGSGDDSLYGGAGDDLLFGNQGVDRLEGGAGNDTLRGGTLRDTFVFHPGSGDDVISDFETNRDLLQVDRAMLGTRYLSGFLKNRVFATDDGLMLEFANGDSLLLQGVGAAADIEDRFVIL